ncbi:MAG: hypothetical protein IPL96_14880 [Holophagaceae bacterium]|nr:hypothetical protein [Holophagaceae bacterium]
MKDWRQGLAVWALLLACAWGLPGSTWKAAQAPPFPWAILLPTTAAFAILVVASLGMARAWGPRAARSRLLGLWEAVPDLLWGAGFLALRPAAWGHPGFGTWMVALLVSALPGEVRWLSQALPAEFPFPAAWGTAFRGRWRSPALVRLLPSWLAARLPVWITATLVLERLLNVRGLGSDWSGRVAARDHAGLAAWIAAFGLAWLVTETSRRQVA